jgi:anti-anti-sigma factor
MPPNELPPMSVFPRGDVLIGSDPLRNVVWVRGEHDLATRVHLSVVIAKAARLDAADVVVDLSGVTFMDASTIGALVGARNGLAARSRSLSVRAPSLRARRVLDLCGLAYLIDESQSPVLRLVAPALGSWVDVPSSDGGADSAQRHVSQEASVHEPALVMARRRVEPARSIQEPRAPS